MNHTTNDIFKNGTDLQILLSDETVISSHQYPLAIIHTDISQFMLFNDGQGHDKGDEVLATLGETIYRSIIDFKFHIYRYSDEFIIIVYNCDSHHAKELFTLIKNNIDSLKITIDHKDHPDTLNKPLTVKSTYRILPHSKSGEIVNAVRAMQKELYEKIEL